MDTVIHIWNWLIENYGHWGIALIFTALVCFATQIWLYCGYYSSIPRFRNDSRQGRPRKEEGISVVVLLGDNNWYLENSLPKMLAQDFPIFEVVVVEIGTSEEFSEGLDLLKERYTNLVTTRMDYDPRFPLSNKMAYNVGIKASSYDNIILTTADAYPTSEKWLYCMSKGFENGEVVLGYCGIERREGFANKIMRCSRVMTSVRYLASAINGEPYRGIIHNIGFTKELYFDSKGFDHLNMNLGEDDLFINRIANKYNTSIIMNPRATVREIPWGGLGWWERQRKFYSSTASYYPLHAKNLIQWDLGSRLFFFATIIVLILIMPFEIKIAGAGLIVIRAVMVRYQLWRIRRRLGEKKLGSALILYDIIEPFGEIWLFVSSRFRPPAGVWR